MKVYAICFDGLYAEIARLAGLETVTATPELAEATPDDELRKPCPDIDFTISGISEINRETMRLACELGDAIIGVARILASRASISVEESLYYIENLICAAQGSEECLYKLSDKAIVVDDYISKHRAESMEPHPVIVIFPALVTLRLRTLRDLYGQGVDAGPLASRPGLTRPADDGLRRAETGELKGGQHNEALDDLRKQG